MDTSEAIKIVEALAKGVDPTTGELFEESSPYNHPSVIRALFLALKALEQVKDRGRRDRGLPDKAGTPWSAEEDQRLLEAFDQGIDVNELAERHCRTRGAIAARLVRLGRITERSEVWGGT